MSSPAFCGANTRGKEEEDEEGMPAGAGQSRWAPLPAGCCCPEPPGRERLPAEAPALLCPSQGPAELSVCFGMARQRIHGHASDPFALQSSALSLTNAFGLKSNLDLSRREWLQEPLWLIWKEFFHCPI